MLLLILLLSETKYPWNTEKYLFHVLVLQIICVKLAPTIVSIKVCVLANQNYSFYLNYLDDETFLPCTTFARYPITSVTRMLTWVHPMV